LLLLCQYVQQVPITMLPHPLSHVAQDVNLTLLLLCQYVQQVPITMLPHPLSHAVQSVNLMLQLDQLVLQENIGIMQIIDVNLILNQLRLALLAPTLMLHQPQNLAACIVFQII
jgi:hypothetical protein